MRAAHGPSAVLAACLGLCSLSASADPADRPAFAAYHKLDRRELALLEPLYADAVEALEHGELALTAGHLEQAERYFRHAAERAPTSALPLRKLCETLTRQGRRQAALQSCTQAVMNRAAPMEFQAATAAILLAAPTPAELAQVMLYARRAKELMPTQSFGYVAQCAIAKRLGDRQMQKDCVVDFRSNAPGPLAEREARELEASLPSPWRWRLGLGALPVAGLLTLAHALRRRWRASRRSSKLGTAATVVTALLVLAMPGSAWADTGSSTRWKIDPANPSAAIPSQAEANADPIEFSYLLMELAARGDDAMDEPDYPKAIRYYRALAKAAPGNAVPVSQLCKAYEGAGERALALENCRAALGLPGAKADDHVRYSRLTLSKQSRLSDKELADVEAVIAHLRSKTDTEIFGHHVACELGARLSDEKRLESCTSALAKLAPTDPKTLTFQWTLAMHKGDLARAEQLIEQARAAKLSPAALEKMTAATAQAQSPLATLLRHWRLVVSIVAALGLAAVALALLNKRKSVLHAA